MTVNPLRRLQVCGQSIWMDFLRRGVILSGELKRWIEEDGLQGVTSNPSIFEKAIVDSHDYDEEVRALARDGKTAAQIYEAITVEDIRNAADLFRPTYDRLRGGDGFVSIEVSPHLAHDTEGTIAEARRLWSEVRRPNVMIKVPATRAGLTAIERLVAEGVNVNITLLFGLTRYEEVAGAYLSGLEARVANQQPIDRLASVASFFLSRIDVLLDPRLEQLARESGARGEVAARAHGEVAIASAKVAYQSYKRIFGTDRFRSLQSKGARVQRLLWASTSAKNPAYSDVKYVESLIGPETINTLPLETFEAYRDHGDPAVRLEHGAASALQLLHQLAERGVDLDQVTQQLEDEGIAKFVAPFDKLLDTLERRRTAATRPEGEHGEERALRRVTGLSTRTAEAVRGEAGSELGMVGLGVMGRNLLLNFSDAGFRVAGYDREPSMVVALRDEAQRSGVSLASSLRELVGHLKRPRAVLLLVPAGEAVDAVVGELTPLLDPGDVVVDGGNSHFVDTDRRGRTLAERGLLFIGLGISGGERGARHGASLMAGGRREAYERIRPLLEAAAARVDGDRCVAWLGPGSAGHYVKMVHNGIEYGLMQLIAEIYDLLTRGSKRSSPSVGRLFKRWNETELRGYLVEITSRVLADTDEETGRPLVELVRGIARQKGTGLWASQDALALQVPTPTIDAAVASRYLSALPERATYHRILGGQAAPVHEDPARFETQQRGALYSSMLLTYAQGFSLLRAASRIYGYQLDLKEVARIWRGGCIIRSQLLEQIGVAFHQNPGLANLVGDPVLAQETKSRDSALRAVVRAALELGIPAPALMASLAYLDSLRSERLPANLIQAQRDCFGAHTYERIDRPGSFHTDWMPT